MLLERNSLRQRRKGFFLKQNHFLLQLQEPPDYCDSPVSGSQERDRDRVELIKLPAHSSNGTVPLNIPSFASSTPETEAPLNLSLKPQQSSSLGNSGSNSAQHSSLSSLSSLSASLGTPGATERTCKSFMSEVFFLMQEIQFILLRTGIR